jgi:hypothetical protein
MAGRHDESRIQFGEAMTPEAKHTPPQTWERKGFQIACQRGVIAEVPLPQQGGVFDCDANAEFILRACQSHEALLAALKELSSPQIIGFIGRREDIPAPVRERVIAAIAQAEGRLA